VVHSRIQYCFREISFAICGEVLRSPPFCFFRLASAFPAHPRLSSAVGAFLNSYLEWFYLQISLLKSFWNVSIALPRLLFFFSIFRSFPQRPILFPSVLPANSFVPPECLSIFFSFLSMSQSSPAALLSDSVCNSYPEVSFLFPPPRLDEHRNGVDQVIDHAVSFFPFPNLFGKAFPSLQLHRPHVGKLSRTIFPPSPPPPLF